MKLRFASMTVGMTAGVTAAVLVACGTAAYIYSAHHFASLLETARVAAVAKGDLIRVALEHQMMENDRTLISRMIDSFGKQPRVEQVMVLDRHGVERYSSRPHAAGDDELRLDSPTCQACHRLPPEQRGSSRVIETRGGTVLRTVVPIHNRQECHRCHDPSHKINGILILDYDTQEMQAAMTRDLRWMVGGTGALTLLLVGAIAILIRVVVVRRLQRFETVARLIAGGDLQRRVPAEGTDTLAWLAREFNTMADSVTGLVSEVDTQRQQLETVINSIDDGIVVLDAQRKIIAANDAFVQRAGHARDQMLGCCCRELAPAGCNAADCPTIACLRTGARQVRISEHRRSDGTAAWEEIHASPILDSGRNPKYVVEVWRDISERRAAEAHLAESHRLASIGFLASGFSHEMNTPLATVLTCVEGILRDLSSGQKSDADLERMRESASIAREQILRCRGVTQHFLRMSRGGTASPGVVNLGDTITAVERLVQPTARAQSVMLCVQRSEPGIHVRADEAELQNVLINLLLNAVQACKAGGKVVLSIEAADQVRIRITDTGCGIGPENLKRIFEPFFSLRQNGTGLGLFLSLNCIRRWGGDIRVESVEGQGSTFEISLPALVNVEAREVAV